MKIIFVYLTFSNREETEKIIRILLKNRLIVCANFWPVNSFYRWQGKIERNKEIVLILKTKKKYFSQIERIIKKNHSYSLPFIGQIEIKKLNPEYRKYLEKELK